MSIKCKREGCSHDAFLVPMINIPAVGHPIDTHTPMKSIIDLPICKDHYTDIKVEDFLDATLRENLTDMLASIGKAPPDFPRAWVSKLKIDSDEYRSFKGAIA